METKYLCSLRKSAIRLTMHTAPGEVMMGVTHIKNAYFIKILLNNSKRLSLVLVLALLMLFAEKSFGQIIAWDFTANAGSETSVSSTTTNANLNTSTIIKGSGLSNPSGANAFSGSFGAVGYSTGTTSLATSITAQQYLQFNVSAKAGFMVSLTTLNANFLRSTNNAPNSFQWQYSLDAFGTAGVNTGSPITYSLFTTGTAANGTAQTQINLSGISNLQNVVSGTTITIRIYGWGANNTGSTFALGKLSGNDLAIGGTVSPLSAPTITTQPTSQAVCFGTTSVSFTAAAGGIPTPQVQWQKNSVNIPGATSTTYLLSSPTSADNGSYRAVFSNSQGSVTSNAATLIVNALPFATVTGQTNLTCFGVNTGEITILGSGGTAPYTFSINNGLTYPGSGNPSYQFTNLPAGNNYKIRVKDINGCASPAIP